MKRLLTLTTNVVLPKHGIDRSARPKATAFCTRLTLLRRYYISFFILLPSFRLDSLFPPSCQRKPLSSKMSSNSVNGFANPAQNGDYTPLRAQFPDGIKTSGQHAPYYDELRSYEDFPEEITGPTVWKAAEYQDNPERWTHQLTEQEINEISKAADHFKASGLPLLNISKVFCSNVGSLGLTYTDN